MLEFSYQLQDFYGFNCGKVRSSGGKMNVDVLVAISSPLILVEKSVFKLQKQQFRRDVKNNLHEA